MLTQTLMINLTQSKLAPIIMRSEEKGREISFQVIDEAGDPVDITDYILKYIQLKPDGNVIYQDLSGGVLTQTEQMTTATGKGYYCIRISDDDTMIYSGQGPVIIDDHVVADETLDSISEVNGLVFPDDFLTSTDLSDYAKLEDLDDYVSIDDLPGYLTDYATINYVDTAISQIQTLDIYSTTEKIVGKWINGKDLYECTFVKENIANDADITLIASGIDFAFVQNQAYYKSNTYESPGYISRYGASGNCTQSLYVNGGRMGFNNNFGGSVEKVIITVRYTKL